LLAATAPADCGLVNKFGSFLLMACSLASEHLVSFTFEAGKVLQAVSLLRGNANPSEFSARGWPMGLVIPADLGRGFACVVSPAQSGLGLLTGFGTVPADCVRNTA
jgi:hypothetical protein